MIVTQNSSGTVTSTEGIPSFELRIKPSGKMFKSMLDSIYRDKPGSIVRELSANALDAHTVNGNPERPFVIHVPDTYEPYFGIRDYGCSMSPKQVEDVYSVLFESSKDDSNDQVGGFGLGGKNFLSYQDSGTIVTYLDGTKYSFVLMYNEHGKPVVHPFGSEPTDEENGVYIEVAVRESDYHLFRDAIVTQLRWLKVKPELINNTADIEIYEPSLGESYGNFTILNNERGFWAVQGQIGYPVNLNEVSNHIKNRNALEFFQAFNGGVMNFNIGDILVTLGREDIQYEPHTLDSIERFIAEVAPIMAKDIKTHIDSLDTVWEQMRYINSTGAMFRVAKLAGIELKDELTKIIISNNQYQIDASFLTQITTKIAFSNYEKGKRKYFNTNGVHINPSKNITIIIRDNVKNAVARLKWFQSTHNAPIYLIEHKLGAEHITEEFISDVQKRLGCIAVVRASELPDPPKNSVGKRGTPVVYRWHGDKNAFDKINRWTKVYDEDEIENGYYIEFNDYPSIYINATQREILKNATAGGDISANTPIYAIKSKNVKLFEENINFHPISEIADKVYAEAMAKFKNISFIKRFILAEKISNETQHVLSRLRLDKLCKPDIDRISVGNHPIAKIMRLHQTTTNIVNNLQATYLKDMKLKGLSGVLFREVCSQEKIKMADRKLDIVDPNILLQRYPQLTWLSGNYKYTELMSKQVIDYIEFMDSHLTSEEA